MHTRFERGAVKKAMKKTLKTSHTHSNSMAASGRRSFRLSRPISTDKPPSNTNKSDDQSDSLVTLPWLVAQVTQRGLAPRVSAPTLDRSSAVPFDELSGTNLVETNDSNNIDSLAEPEFVI